MSEERRELTREELTRLINSVRGHEMTPAELQQQRISFAYGNQSHRSNISREQVAEADYKQHGNLAEMEKTIAALTGLVKAYCPFCGGTGILMESGGTAPNTSVQRQYCDHGVNRARAALHTE